MKKIAKKFIICLLLCVLDIISCSLCCACLVVVQILDTAGVETEVGHELVPQFLSGGVVRSLPPERLLLQVELLYLQGR